MCVSILYVYVVVWISVYFCVEYYVQAVKTNLPQNNKDSIYLSEMTEAR